MDIEGNRRRLESDISTSQMLIGHSQYSIGENMPLLLCCIAVNRIEQ